MIRKSELLQRTISLSGMVVLLLPVKSLTMVRICESEQQLHDINSMYQEHDNSQAFEFQHEQGIITSLHLMQVEMRGGHRVHQQKQILFGWHRSDLMQQIPESEHLEHGESMSRAMPQQLLRFKQRELYESMEE